ncbi:hypothetical protein [Ketogulonicigenium vulgare]|uniref:Antifreeze glycopeptide polyprotein n=1 Tax=Ketogulonicigenium vulgare (strain WSH-001) TaxID=759362 RepID=F9Y3R4_KETVW|nr:hypothetical protein [Ketogulonicigenium vulgare]ADO42226.1 conserved hypothetical protein [Ketogulonicigenium vulgare Y25]AEM40428.1 hypothetical protein KVU_0589 [Ketogulonicigenium vulgare WSH-001]ALJ80616.1 hypothetical protein KVH_05140 [Ketogulonicigenium vulgare]ANW33434.1 hypothetical protein KvSKV_05110 [Ketogulonicigenium vulgare]AOZ54143.1 hypothetical protein KVC_1126 [Ketogulonicigenium vulgare]
MRIAQGLGLIWLTIAGAAVAQERGPLSAIDWLSESVTPAPPASPTSTAPVTGGVTPEITVQSLDAPSPDIVGLLPSDVTGLPTSLWSQSPESDALAALRATPAPSLPALQELLVQLMLAEAAPPSGAAATGNLFLARVDKLLEMGALDQAQSLIEASDVARPEVFRRWFDASLLTGTEDFACTKLNEMPAIAPTLSTHVFCLARAGDWPAAALVLNNALSLGAVNADEQALLVHFLDPEMDDGDSILPEPTTLTPLEFRMREAVGEAIPTATLPRAFANADLRSMVAWRSQIEAAERLARGGALSENALVGFYTAHIPAASGGIWDRARAVQDFERALATGAETALDALPALYDGAKAARVEVPLARFYAEALVQPDFARSGNAAALEMGLLSPDYESVAALQRPANANSREALLIAVARGQVTEGTPVGGWAGNPFVGPVINGFTLDDTPNAAADLINAGKLGEGLLKAITGAEAALTGDPAALAPALAALRLVGLEDVARRIALQVLLLDRTG